MKTKFYLFILIISILCIASDCGRDNIPTYYMPQEFKDYVDFPVGSYWIYEDSVSGAVDSIYLFERNITIAQPSSGNYKWEKLIQRFQSVNGTIDNNAIAVCIDPIIYHLWTSYFVYGNFIYKKNMELGFEIEGTKYIKFYDSLKINNKWYTNIKCFTNKFNNNTYWGEKTGIVRKEIKTLYINNLSVDTNIVWNLKSYHINY